MGKEKASKTMKKATPAAPQLAPWAPGQIVTAEKAAPVGSVKEPVRIGLIGIGGGIGPLHISELQKNPNFRLVAGGDNRLDDPAVRPHAERLTSAGGKLYSDYRQLLADASVEAVVIAAPHFLHREITVAAFAAGKHVLVEKPMATHPDDCRAMIQARDQAGKVGAVHMQHVGRNSMLDLRRKLNEGAIGPIREVFLSSLWWREDSYYNRARWSGKKMFNGAWNLDGVMYNQAIHYLTQTLILAAPGQEPAVAGVTDLQVGLYRFHATPALEMEDAAFITGKLAAPGSPRLIAFATTCSRTERHLIEIIGAKGRAMWNGAGYLFPDGQPVLDFPENNRDFEGVSPVYNSFAEAVRGGATPLTDFSRIARVTEFIFNVYEQAAWKIRPAPWSATENLAQVVQQAQRQRTLPAALNPKPRWA